MACGDDRRRRGAGGFTLVELMVVIAIMALATAAVLFALPDPRGSLREEAETFAAHARAAQDTAIMQARPVALVTEPGGYRFETRDAGRWVAMAAGTLPPERWRKGTRAIVTGAETRAVFDPTGLGDPIEVTLSRGAARVMVRVGMGGAIDVAG